MQKNVHHIFLQKYFQWFFLEFHPKKIVRAFSRDPFGHLAKSFSRESHMNFHKGCIKNCSKLEILQGIHLKQYFWQSYIFTHFPLENVPWIPLKKSSRDYLIKPSWNLSKKISRAFFTNSFRNTFGNSS